ncbi:hypothetical protein [Clostridium lacusfryxellense]|uniref:hypothetical protein n=1 Tax=Clostridium lacusfryxellense TaxID=205328 RepID=UPI001C0E7724|nr:hypothetical protein [Clostridium lacusfryxellense]MBU3113684.1 hypothetical protein [Clostridium lacusfryxellense]
MPFNDIKTERLENQRSIRLIENLGFVLSDSSYELFRGKEYLHNTYSLYIPQLI